MDSLQRDSAAKWLVAIVLIVVVVAALLLIKSVSTKVQVQIGDTVVSARVAKTDSQRQKGLSDTEHLPANEGMLFVFDSNGKWPIWMKDMHYNIDILWLDEHKRVVSLQSNVPPSSYPTNFTPSKPARYVLELPAGFAAEHHIQSGTAAQFTLH